MSRAERFQRTSLCFLAFVLVLNATSGAQDNPLQTRGSEFKTKDEELFSRVWSGVQGAQSRYQSGCGKISEVRTSRLLARPIVFNGRFCASGTEKFSLEYFEPERIRLVYNRDYLNVTTGKGKRTTEVLKIGGNVERTQRYFSGKDSIKNLRDNFVISIKESHAAYTMKFIPRSQRFRQKINYVSVTLRKSDFLLSRLEFDGTSGVNSVFTIEIESLNRNTGEDSYEVYRP